MAYGTTTKSNDINSLGGKGIGRLTMFALGDTISVETTNNFKKSIFKLDKKELANDGDLNSVTLNVSQEKDNKKQQTIIRITNIIVEYLDKDKIQKDLQNLFKDENDINFTILPTDQKKLTQNYIPVADGTKYATLHSNFVLNAKMLSVKHTAAVHLWDKKKDIPDTSVKEINKYVLNNKDLFQSIGDVSFDVYHFYEPQNTKTPYSLDKKFNKRDIQNRLLSYAGGINIYRKGTKLFGYGLNDWLDLEYESRNDSSKISNSRTLGTILLSPDSEQYLVEKSNRESLKTTTKAYQVFKQFIVLCIEQINEERRQVKGAIIELATNISKTQEVNKDVGKQEVNKDIDKHQEKEINAKIEFLNKKVSIKVQDSYNIMENINLQRSMDQNGSRFSSYLLVFYINGKDNKSSYLHPQDAPTKKIVVVKNQAGTISNSFEIIVKPNNIGHSRDDLFPINSGDHFNLESQDDNNFLRVFLTQLNELWVSERYDYVVTGSMRTIIDYQLSFLNKKISELTNGKEFNLSKDWILQNMQGDFRDIESLLNLIFNQDDLKDKVAEYLNCKSKNEKKNFWRKFVNSADQSKPGEYFKNKLQKSHTGAHKPQGATNPMEIIGLADYQKNFLELSSAYLKVLESSICG
ncbi:histidine kinase [Leuconostoc gasicomitatum]|uniref:histidine kinase n=1 Tax=Leuconostoc gasicomitatum TaxID=115778 RepID=UPI001CC49643|nr:histidine kinase [Leuconostoc gasicomitatum]